MAGSSVAFAQYWITFWSGVTWPYKITVFMAQTFTLGPPGGAGGAGAVMNTWQLSQQADSWFSGWDPVTGAPAISGVRRYC